jgi:hypothetical protein
MTLPSGRPSCLQRRTRPCDKLEESICAGIVGPVGGRSSSCALTLTAVKVAQGIRVSLVYPLIYPNLLTDSTARDLEAGADLEEVIRLVL